jgi:hypothetical protein
MMSDLSEGRRDRQGRALLRAAAAAGGVQAALHLFLFVRAAPAPGSTAGKIVTTMRDQALPGAPDPSYWSMYFGYGLLAAMSTLVGALLVLLLSTFDAGSRRLARRLTGLLVVANLAHAGLVSIYFFPLPILFDLLVAFLLGTAWLALGKPHSAPSNG